MKKQFTIKGIKEVKALTAACNVAMDIWKDYACESLPYPEKLKSMTDAANCAAFLAMMELIVKRPIQEDPNRFERTFPVDESVYHAVEAAINLYFAYMDDCMDADDPQMMTNDNIDLLIAITRLDERLTIPR